MDGESRAARGRVRVDVEVDLDEPLALFVASLGDHSLALATAARDGELLDPDVDEVSRDPNLGVSTSDDGDALIGVVPEVVVRAVGVVLRNAKRRDVNPVGVVPCLSSRAGRGDPEESRESEGEGEDREGTPPSRVSSFLC